MLILHYIIYLLRDYAMNAIHDMCLELVTANADYIITSSTNMLQFCEEFGSFSETSHANAASC
jgi:hypothetical protein